MLHLPLLRRGVPYRSLDVAKAPHHATGKPFVEISQANVGLIRRDLLKQDEMRASLARVPVARLVEMVREAAGIFRNDTLPDGRRAPAARRLRRAALGHDGHAVRDGAPQHGARRERDGARRRHPARPDARPRPRRARPRLRRLRRTGRELLSQGAGARRRAPEQLARRARLVDPGRRAEDAARAASRRRRAVDAVPAACRRSSRLACRRTR